MGFVPMTELNEHCWNVPLPEFVDAERIGVSIGRLGVLANLAGFDQHVHVHGAQGETTQHTPMIVGGDGQGNAYAGVGASQTARLGDFRSERASDQPSIGVHPPSHLSLRLNTAEMTQRLQEQHANLRDPAPWAKLISASVGQGLREAAWAHNMRPRLSEGAVLAVTIAGATIIAPELDSVSVLATGYAGFQLTKALVTLMDQKNPREVCWSVLPAVHPDRALAVSGLSRMLHVVKVLP